MAGKEKKVDLGKFKEPAKKNTKVEVEVVPDEELAPEKPPSSMSFSQQEEPLVLVMDGEKAEEWIVHGHLRVRGVFDRVEVTGEGLENRSGRTGIPGMVVSMAVQAAKPGSVIVIPEHLAEYAENLGLEKAKGKNKAGFLSFVK